MVEGLGAAIESHLIRAVLVSGVMALVLTAGAAVIWWRGRRWTKSRVSAASPAQRHLAAFSRTSGTGGSFGEDDPQPEAGHRTGAEQLASRFVRDAAAHTAALRETWDRSYREARGPRPGDSTPDVDVSGLLQDVLREQRETNALLRELLGGLKERPD